MRTSRLLPLVLVVLALLLVPAAVAPTAAAAPGGNSPNAKLCQKGGWTQLQGADGTRFASEAACVAYAAQGGTLQPVPTGTVTVSFITIPGLTTECGVRVDVAGFAPGTYDAVITEVTVDGSSGSTTQPLTVGPDGTGFAETIVRDVNGIPISGTVVQEGSTVTATVNGVTSAPAVVAC
jgi:hypothetical protein